jgi:hypothetical protein
MRKEWIRYMGNETLPRKTKYGWERIRRRDAEKWIAKMRSNPLRSGNAHLKSTTVRTNDKRYTASGKYYQTKIVQLLGPHGRVWTVGGI